MASKTYVDLQGPAVDAAWLNDTNNVVYNVLGDGTNAPSTANNVLTNLGLTSTTGAGLIGSTPVGGITATDVQGAIAQLATGTGLSVAASAVTFVPTSTIAATDVQAAVTEVVSDLAATTGAATVGNTATGVITATNVQNALNQIGAWTTTGNNLGTGTGTVFINNTGIAGNNVLNYKTIKAGTNISITNNANDITIASSGGGSGPFFLVEDYGAVGDGTTDDTTAFTNAIAAASAAGGGTVIFKNRYYLANGVTVLPRVVLSGVVDLPGATMPYSSFNPATSASVLYIPSTKTISVQSSASVCHGTIIRYGLTLPFANASAATTGVASFAGTAITCSAYNSEDTYLHHLFILGFAQAIYSTNNNRTRIEYVQGDCTSGIELDVEYDVAYVSYCHFWPFTTSQQSWVTPTLLTRSGTAYKFSSVGDWSRFTNCFSYGYATGFSVVSCNEVNFVNCSADYDGSLSSSSTGFSVTGSSINTTFIGCHAAAQSTGIYVSISGSVSNNVKINGCSFWANDYAAIYISNGRGIISNNTFFQNARAIVSTSGSGHVIIGNDFDQESSPLVFNSGDLRQSTIIGNNYVSTTEAVGHNIVKDGAAVRFTGTAANTALAGLLLTGRASQGSLNSPSAGAANQSALTAIGLIHDGSDYQTAGYMRIQNDAGVSSGSTPGKWVFSTTPSASTSAVDRVVVTKDGHLTPTSDNAYTCGASGVRWSAVWAANGTIQTSDQRTKTQIADATLGLDFINKLRPVSYKFIVGGNKILRQVYRDEQGNEVPSNAENAIPAEIITEEVPGERTHWGLISQEVKAAMDESGVDFGGWVLSDKSDPNSQQALRYDEFIAPLIKAVQELSAEVTALKSKLP